MIFQILRDEPGLEILVTLSAGSLREALYLITLTVD